MTTSLPRRRALQALGATAASLVAACSAGDGGSAGTGGTGGGGGAGGGTGGTGGSSGGGWASGGTQALSGKDYGDPFASGVGPTCTPYDSSTEGPCHAPSPERQDVSEGYPGVPMRLELLVVDAACGPVAGATVEIWHCDTHGVYSGDIDGNNDDFCTGGDATAATASWYRGVRTAGADGRVTFDSNFPGWYGGRATHVHFRITVGGVERLVSQLFFDEALKSDVYGSQADYDAPSGAGYVLNVDDNVVSESGLALEDVVCSWAQQPDGVLLAWKAIAIG